MNEPLDQLDSTGFRSSDADLRAALEQTRKEAELEIARLNRKLSERELAMAPDVTSATERQAMQQELLTLQNALKQKERTLDRIVEECRRLEDELEDQHVAFDGLKQEVERKESSLKSAREEVERLRRQTTGERESSQSIDGYSELAAAAHSTLLPPDADTDASPRPPALRKLLTVSVGVMFVLVSIGLIALLAWIGVRIDLPHWAQSRDVQPAPAPAAVPAEPPPAAVALPSAVAPPTPVRTVRDRLRDGSLGPTLAVLPGGTFRMGANSLSGDDTGPEHEVAIAPFLIGLYEVTFSQYDRFAMATGRSAPEDFGWGRGDRPVVGVSWSGAVAYAAWLSRQTGKRYYLPSEAQWEFAARAGGRGSYWWGFGLEPGRAVCYDCGSAWDKRSTAPVGSYPPNPFGLYDTAGNAMEWVADCYAPSYDGAPTDGQPRTDGDCTYRVARGGAFNKPAASMRVYVRTRLSPETQLNMIGFRIARDP